MTREDSNIAILQIRKLSESFGHKSDILQLFLVFSKKYEFLVLEIEALSIDAKKALEIFIFS